MTSPLGAATSDHISKFLDPHTVRRRPRTRAVMGAIDLMVGHCRDPLTIEAIATRVGVSEDHLIRVFREAFGEGHRRQDGRGPAR